MKTSDSSSVQYYKLRRAYDRAVKRWKKTMRQNAYTLAAFQDMYEAGERLKSFLADRGQADF